MCQTCIDDGAVSVWMADVLDAFVERYGDDEEYGVGHAVVADYNVDDVHVDYCLSQSPWQPVLGLLLWMKTVPRLERCPQPMEDE